MKSISVTDLGILERCERCFWYILKGIRRPQVFPSILGAMDNMIKLDVARKARLGEKIRWLGEGVVLAGIEKRMETEYSGVRLKGEIDELVKVKDGYVVIDYKVSSSPYDEGKANHYYATQLSAYAFLCEENGYAPVRRGELIFYYPVLLNDKMMTWGIAGVFTNIDIDKVKAMLRRAYEISMMSIPPFGNCEWCRYVDERAKFQR